MNWSGDIFWLGIFLAKFGPTLTKNSLNVLLISVPSEIIVPSVILNLFCIFFVLFLLMIFSMICHVFFMLSYNLVNHDLREWYCSFTFCFGKCLLKIFSKTLWNWLKAFSVSISLYIKLQSIEAISLENCCRFLWEWFLLIIYNSEHMSFNL